MLSRLSSVDYLKVQILSFSSIIQIGDSTIVNGFSQALAVQREEEIYIGNEGSFEAYQIFREPIPFLPITENIQHYRKNINPLLRVSNLKIIGATAASVIHIGSTAHVHLESRVKHIRQLTSEKPKPKK